MITLTSGKKCYYNNGLLVKCGDFLVPCTDELLKFATDFAAVPGANCKQWEGPCATASEIYRSGTVAIGTDSRWGELSGYKLVVKGGIGSEMLQLCKEEWCDYVFSDTFHLIPLLAVKRYIQANGHLPDCTPGSDIEQAGGFLLGDETIHQQKKIEEIFLHLIALRKRLDVINIRTEHLGIILWSPASSGVRSPTINAEVRAETKQIIPLPALTIVCFQIVPATGDNTTDGQAGIRVSGMPASPLIVQWTGPLNGSLSNQTCTDGVIKLTGLKKGTYSIKVIAANGQTATYSPLDIAKSTPVDCTLLGQEPCKTEIFNAIKGGFNITQPTCKQWEGDLCSASANIYRLGNVGIGSNKIPAGYSLAVKGGILTDHFFIELCETHGWCDYVFDPGYPLLDLYAIERYIKSYQHLPGTITQAEVMKEDGIELGSVKIDQQKKIEESFLYLIEMNKKMEDLKTRIESFE